MSAEYQPNLSFVSQIPAEFLKLREYSANPDISWICLSASRNKKKFGWGVCTETQITKWIPTYTVDHICYLFPVLMLNVQT